MTEEAGELHRMISTSVRDMLDASRIQVQVGPVPDKGHRMQLRSDAKALGRHQPRAGTIS